MNKKEFSALAALCAACVANPDGFTVNAQTFAPVEHGFSVAVAGTQNSHGVAGAVNVLQYAQTHPEISAFGGWLDSETGKYYIDAVCIIEDLATALELAKENKQLAIFDLDNMREIRVK